MSMFSFNDSPVVVPVETTEEPDEAVQEFAEIIEDHYADVDEEDYTTADEPDFGDDI